MSRDRFPTPTPTTETAAEPEVEFNLAEHLRTLRRHWKILAALILVALTVSLVRYSMTPKQYQAAARIQIERRSINPLLGNTSPWMENWWNMEYYPTQYKLLESHHMARQAARILRLDNPTDAGAPATDAADADRPVTADDDEAALDQLAASIRGGLQVAPIRNTQLVDLVYRSGSPEVARDRANAYAEAFVQYNYEARSTTASSAGKFLEEQITQLKMEISEKQEELQRLSRSTDIVALDPESNVTLQRLDTLNRQYMAAKNSRIEAKARLDAMRGSSAESVAGNEAEGLVSQLRGQLLRQEAEYNTKLQTYKEDWPEMVELRQSIQQTRQELTKLVNRTASDARQDANASYQAALRSEQALDAEIREIKSEAIDEQMTSIALENLRVEVETRQDLLNQLLRQRSQTVLTSNLQGFDKDQQNNVRIIDHATLPRVAMFPSLRRSILMGLLAGLGLGVGAVVLIEYLDRTVKSAEEAERLLGLPTLAVIPDVQAGGKSYGYGYGYGSETSEGQRGRRRDAKGSGDSEVPAIELLPHVRSRFPVSEAYRSLRTALLLSTAEELKVVGVTSAQTGEGKTATATNLAVVMAQLGRRVLLVDADLRKPRLHKVFNLPNRYGLVNVLTEGTPPDQLYRPVDVPDLYVLPSGPQPPNPAELLASDRMREFLRRERHTFDFVVIDTTPTLAVTDATLVGSMVDGMLLCLRAHKVTREEARDTRDRLQLAEVKILGTVLNRYRLSSGGRYGARYRQYQAYGETVMESEDSAA